MNIQDWFPLGWTGLPGQGGVIKGRERALGGDKFIMLTVVMVLWIHMYVKTYQFYPLNMCTFFMSLYLNKAKTTFIIKMSGSQIS